MKNSVSKLQLPARTKASAALMSDNQQIGLRVHHLGNGNGACQEAACVRET